MSDEARCSTTSEQDTQPSVDIAAERAKTLVLEMTDACGMYHVTAGYRIAALERVAETARIFLWQTIREAKGWPGIAMCELDDALLALAKTYPQTVARTPSDTSNTESYPITTATADPEPGR